MSYNLGSPNGITRPADLDDLSGWFSAEVAKIGNDAEWHAVEHVAQNLDSFVRWAREALLLWPGNDRIAPPGKKQKYHLYPDHIRQMASACSLALDRRPNGPAIASFRLAGGERPLRSGSSNAWSIHHLYFGKFPYVGRQFTTHAAKESCHFTQSAGLIAVHPIADAMADEFPFFSWLLRALAFDRFGYDPDGVFCTNRDGYGFCIGRKCQVIESPPDRGPSTAGKR